MTDYKFKDYTHCLYFIYTLKGKNIPYEDSREKRTVRAEETAVEGNTASSLFAELFGTATPVQDDGAQPALTHDSKCKDGMWDVEELEKKLDEQINKKYYITLMVKNPDLVYALEYDMPELAENKVMKNGVSYYEIDSGTLEDIESYCDLRQYKAGVDFKMLNHGNGYNGRHRQIGFVEDSEIDEAIVEPEDDIDF